MAVKLSLGIILAAAIPFGLASRPAHAHHNAAPAPQSDVQAIRNELDAWMAAFNARDTNAVCDIFASGLRFDAGPNLDETRTQLCARLHRILTNDAASYRYALQIREIKLFGDTAIVRPLWTLTVTRRGGHAARATTEPGLDVMRRNRDGTWKIVRFMAYTVPP